MGDVALCLPAQIPGGSYWYLEVRRMDIIDEIKEYGNGKANYMPYDNAVSYPLHTQDFVRTGFQDLSPTLAARNYKDPKITVEVKRLGGLAETQSRLVYDADGISPCLTASMGPKGNTMPYITEINVMGKLDENSNQRNVVYDADSICPTIQAACGAGGGNTPLVTEVAIAAQRGRDKDNPSFRGASNGNFEQILELNSEGIANTITTVQKDNLVVEKTQTENKDRWVWNIDGIDYQIRIRKLTPRECWRLMGFLDSDFDAASQVNSNTQLYKQAGNSICVPVLEELFKAMMENKK